MRLKISAMIASGFVAGAIGLAAAPAEAQTKKPAAAPVAAGTRYVIIDEDRRTRTKVIVQRRSYLDAGTEVRPGERKFTDYVYPPGYSVTSAIDRTVTGGYRSMTPQFVLPF